MKKIIWASLILFTLASCGAPKIENAADALQQNQITIIKNLEAIQKMTPDQAKSIWEISFALEAQEGRVDASIKYDFKANQTTYETAGNIAIDFNVETNKEWVSPVWNTSGGINLDLITLKNKILFKLNALDINTAEENFQLGIITAMVPQFKNNWYFIDIPDNTSSIFNQELLMKQKEVIALAKKHSLLAHINTNENTDFYDYNVKLNEEGVVNFLMKLKALWKTKTNTGALLSENDITNIKATVINFNQELKWNIKIDKSNLEYFILTFSHEDGAFTLENTETTLNIKINDIQEKTEFSYKGTKSWTKLDGNFLAIRDTKELLNGTLTIKFDGTTTDIVFNATAKDESTDEEFKINIQVTDTTTAEEVIIEEPADTSDFQEVIGQMMNGIMWAPIQMGTDNMGLSIEEEDIDMNTKNMNLKVIDENIEIKSFLSID